MPKTRVRKMWLAIDPGNAMSGIAWFTPEENFGSMAFEPWKLGWESQVPVLKMKAWVMEYNRQRNHYSTAGAHRVGGVILDRLMLHGLGIRRPQGKNFTNPSTWFYKVFPGETLLKKEARKEKSLAFAKTLVNYPLQGDDEADALCMCFALKEGLI